MAWLLAAIAGIPMALVTAWGLAGGYSFRHLPFLLILPALPLLVAPLVAAFLTTAWPNRSAYRAAQVISLGCIVGSGVAVLACAYSLVFELLNIHSDGPPNAWSLFGAGLLALSYHVTAIVAMVRFRARLKFAGDLAPSANRTPVVRRAFVVLVAVALLLVVSGVVGAAKQNRLDPSGLPVEPGHGWMASQPESTLTYGGAEIIRADVSGEDKELSGPGPSEGTVTFYTPDPPQDVGAWYARELHASGWTTVDKPVFAYGETALWEFTRGARERFQLRYYAPGAGLPGNARHPGEAYFTTSYQVYPVGVHF